MATTRLDPIDRKILAELQADGRMTNVELARRVGISAPPCLRRVRTWRRRVIFAGITPTWTRASWGSRCKCSPMLACKAKPRWT